MIRKHFILDEETIKIIDGYRMTNGKKSYSKALSELIFIAKDYMRLVQEMKKVKEEVEKNMRLNYIQLDLLKQLYSDLEIQNLTNPTQNKPLQDFFKNLKGGLDG